MKSKLFFTGFFFLFKDIDDKNIKSFDSLPQTAMQLVHMTLGEFKVKQDMHARIHTHGHAQTHTQTYT